MLRIKKQEMLDIFSKIYVGYENKTHKMYMSSCPLCVKFSCGNCPMSVFNHLKSVDEIFCLNRKCRPINCSDFVSDKKYYEKRLNTVKEFYLKSINYIDSMIEEEFDKTDFKFLIKIDDESYEKFNG